jgi:hypothetical protein
MGTVDAWSGNILLPEGKIVTGMRTKSSRGQTNALPEVFLESPVILPLSLPSQNLRFLAQVEIARIPLYITAGPSLNAWTTSQETEDWFSSLLGQRTRTLDNESLPQPGLLDFGIFQSPVGILVGVESGEYDSKTSRITEILFYSTTSALQQGSSYSAPSGSSSDRDENGADTSGPVVRVHAIPLSSDLLYSSSIANRLTQDQDGTTSASSPLLSNDEAYFLGDSVQPSFMTYLGEIKRKEVSDIFENAAERRMKIRRTGGEGVAAAAAKISGAYPHPRHNRLSSRDSGVRKPQDSAGDAFMEPASSSGFGRSSRRSSTASDARPVSRMGARESKPVQSSSLKAVASLNDETKTIENRNKDAISRIVMASMRMYGLQQRRKTRKSRRSSTVEANDQTVANDEANEVADSSNEEEYKMVYHNTFKSTVFAYVSRSLATRKTPSDLRCGSAIILLPRLYSRIPLLCETRLTNCSPFFAPIRRPHPSRRQLLPAKETPISQQPQT